MANIWEPIAIFKISFNPSKCRLTQKTTMISPTSSTVDYYTDEQTSNAT
jgi:hypothetical protein